MRRALLEGEKLLFRLLSCLMGITKGGVTNIAPRLDLSFSLLHQVECRRQKEKFTLVVSEIKLCVAGDDYRISNYLGVDPYRITRANSTNPCPFLCCLVIVGPSRFKLLNSFLPHYFPDVKLLLIRFLSHTRFFHQPRCSRFCTLDPPPRKT